MWVSNSVSFSVYVSICVTVSVAVSVSVSDSVSARSSIPLLLFYRFFCFCASFGSNSALLRGLFLYLRAFLFFYVLVVFPALCL